jgi:hypothetical protein
MLSFISQAQTNLTFHVISKPVGGAGFYDCIFADDKIIVYSASNGLVATIINDNIIDSKVIHGAAEKDLGVGIEYVGFSSNNRIVYRSDFDILEFDLQTKKERTILTLPFKKEKYLIPPAYGHRLFRGDSHTYYIFESERLYRPFMISVEESGANFNKIFLVDLNGNNVNIRGTFPEGRIKVSDFDAITKGNSLYAVWHALRPKWLSWIDLGYNFSIEYSIYDGSEWLESSSIVSIYEMDSVRFTNRCINSCKIAELKSRLYCFMGIVNEDQSPKTEGCVYKYEESPKSWSNFHSTPIKGFILGDIVFHKDRLFFVVRSDNSNDMILYAFDGNQWNKLVLPIEVSSARIKLISSGQTLYLFWHEGRNKSTLLRYAIIE